MSVAPALRKASAAIVLAMAAVLAFACINFAAPAQAYAKAKVTTLKPGVTYKVGDLTGNKKSDKVKIIATSMKDVPGAYTQVKVQVNGKTVKTFKGYDGNPANLRELEFFAIKLKNGKAFLSLHGKGTGSYGGEAISGRFSVLASVKKGKFKVITNFDKIWPGYNENKYRPTVKGNTVKMKVLVWSAPWDETALTKAYTPISSFNYKVGYKYSKGTLKRTGDIKVVDGVYFTGSDFAEGLRVMSLSNTMYKKAGGKKTVAQHGGGSLTSYQVLYIKKKGSKFWAKVKRKAPEWKSNGSMKWRTAKGWIRVK